MLSRLAALCRPGGIEQTTRVRGRAEEIGRLLPRGVIVGRHQHRVAALGGDLDRRSVIVDLLDQREQGPPRLASCDRHLYRSFVWYRILYHGARLSPMTHGFPFRTSAGSGRYAG